MNLGTKLQYTLAAFISFMLQSVFYGNYRRQHLVQTLTFKRHLILGIYCVIFAAFVRIQYKRAHDGSKSVLLSLVTAANFIACTAYLAVDITAYQTNTLGWLLASNALYTCVDFISQVILVNFLTYDIQSPTLMRVAFLFQ